MEVVDLGDWVSLEKAVNLVDLICLVDVLGLADVLGLVEVVSLVDLVLVGLWDVDGVVHWWVGLHFLLSFISASWTLELESLNIN